MSKIMETLFFQKSFQIIFYVIQNFSKFFKIFQNFSFFKLYFFFKTRIQFKKNKKIILKKTKNKLYLNFKNKDFF